MADGALQIAAETGSDIGAFVCRHLRTGNYLVKGRPVIPADDPQAMDAVKNSALVRQGGVCLAPFADLSLSGMAKLV